MKRPALIKKELEQIYTITGLAAIFEGIASMEIAKIREQTLSSKRFFAELWHIYSQLRVDKGRMQSPKHQGEKIPKTLFIAVTSQGGLSGDIDGRVINAMLKEYSPQTNDIIVLGGHGATLLAQAKVDVIHYYRMPESNQTFDAEPIIEYVMQYEHAIAYYQSYISLSKQDVAKIELVTAVKAMGDKADDEDAEIITQRDYEFEPNFDEIIDHLESFMLDTVLGQIVLESRLPQAASRFNAMAAAKQKAEELQAELRLAYNRARRAASEQRTREIVAVLNNRR